MAKVTYVEVDGTRHDVDVPDGWTLLQGATRAGVDGMEGECGGSCACATCHCYIDEADLARLPEPSAAESEMLDCTSEERLPNSRLGCQVRVTADMDGLTVSMPASQS